MTVPERFLGNTAMTIAFIGAGNMAGSLIRGLQASGTPADHIIAADPAQGQQMPNKVQPDFLPLDKGLPWQARDQNH